MQSSATARFPLEKGWVAVVWIGVDVSKRTLDVCVHGSGQVRTFRQPEELGEAVDFIAAHEGARVVMEATGRYEQPLFEALVARGVPCSIVNPAHAHAFRKSLGKRAKTDAIDAELLARMGDMHQPGPTAPQSPARNKLQALVSRRAQLTKLLTAESNHAEHSTDREVVKSVQRLRRAVEREIAKFDRAIAKHIRETPELAEPAERLQTMPGVGPTIASAILVHLPELGTVGKAEIAALAGLAPFNADSGVRRGHRAIRAGRTPVRSLLYMAALVATRHNPRFRELYARLLGRGKPKKLALIAVARKLLVTLNAMLQKRTEWRPPESPELLV
jgi:transposase